jgi:hypothetical protein
MKKSATLQQNLFDVPTTEADTKLPQNVQMALLKPLVRALLTDLIAAQRLATSVLSPEG